mmetsp:Transcript_2489/g.5942  ORF Transcript_2489/g.5942 Transcript_2489/m.5942 type:complete len:187 (-) Transcript_2489:194-754(-)|eukprot:CAMPEP_0173437502 /NCGR_PEP_ID=MMETSP1357-20121228/18060_1 /TAXON_ID=77926 /ORGANISM="Hemiselmis rufescens, Strain PCC563" /LENGTH=186 /DNA_ID=CAMNT_0014402683 /DNA_START=56 /DNA_END=616 /DNA_ORIENTATION=-
MSSTITSGHTSLMPGTQLPSVTLPLTTGESHDIAKTSGKNRLVIVYRGAFCPFCTNSLKNIQQKLSKLADANIDVLALSADPADVAKKFADENNLTFPVATGLKEADMRALGLYVSDPKDYQPQTYRFAEPAYFLITSEGKIRYICVSSFPMGGRPNVEDIIMGVEWVEGEIKRNPAFQDVIWGSK